MKIFGMVFPGQGSQEVGMLTELATHHKIIKATFSEASDIIKYDLWKRIQKGPSEELNKTWITQQALLTSSVAIWRLWQQQGGQPPSIMSGHSLGEYSALVCSGCLEFKEAITLVGIRGKLMQTAVPTGIGSMAAIIGLNSDIVSSACKEAAQGQVVSPVNFNSPGQVVIGGHKKAVERASLVCKKAGAKYVLPLSVSVPSHCILMKPAAQKLAKILKEVTFLTPKISVINNVDVRIENEPTAIRQALVRQLYNPVRWTESIQYLVSQGVEMLLEIGPGKVLTGLIRRSDMNILSAAVNDPTSLAIAIKR
ncbi:malonyl CoA-acyl carrier protein transacylase [secondary endosymbiont of Heteropsylla cubana]|uniref:Malonyl CoA-acyl carrier protein transacylase n=1 Tax=secondary endosymbiont of Heteropsylla cubana TaxID=134287 RepID=J7GTJ4_9ENTR|nr:ACP S-malonyltransferase [secondary endosymbiont of Heteropsylla cubana]AFP85859.1 malonyl CoA-acyl carrier protein transacylase [secondary endosymbiont of Heteropsylla cubana]